MLFIAAFVTLFIGLGLDLLGVGKGDGRLIQVCAAALFFIFAFIQFDINDSKHIEEIFESDKRQREAKSVQELKRLGVE